VASTIGRISMPCTRAKPPPSTLRREKSWPGELDGDDEDMVRVWMGIHREELFANWKLLDEGDTFFKIEPLR